MRDRLADAKRIADRQHHVADLHLAAVGHRHNRQIVRVNFYHRDVGFWIASNHLGGEIAPILQGHFHLLGPVHDMIVGQNISVLGHDDAGTEAVFNLRPRVARRHHLAKLVAEKLLPEGIIETGVLLCPQCLERWRSFQS